MIILRLRYILFLLDTTHALAEASQIFRDAHISPIRLSYEGYCRSNRFSLRVIHKEGLCPSSGDINRLMMIMIDDDDGGKPNAIWWQSIFSVSAVSRLVAFYDVPGRKGQVLFYYSVSNTT
jgi:hypothetical protein